MVICRYLRAYDIIIRLSTGYRHRHRRRRRRRRSSSRRALYVIIPVRIS